jgi:hypothetical protein
MGQEAQLSVEQVFKAVRERQHQLHAEIRHLGCPDPRTRAAAIRNIMVWGQAVTGTLQRLRSRVEEFDEWYERKREEMRTDPLLKWFRDNRNAVLKQGVDPAMGSGAYLESFNSNQMPPSPPGATTFFLLDERGGCGFEIELPDGSTDKVYVALPESCGHVFQTVFLDAPDEHLGQMISDSSAPTVCVVYVDYLDRLVAEARELFGPTA